MQSVNAIVLSGGSAFGLDATTGVMRYLEEHGIGYDARGIKVPIVPGASLIDLHFGGDYKIRPNAECGYKAAQAASDGPVPEGNVGAGTTATPAPFRRPIRPAMAIRFSRLRRDRGKQAPRRMAAA